MKTLLVSLLFVLLGLVNNSLAQTVLYVDADATGPVHNGSTWCEAYLFLQDALTDAAASGGTVEEIRVADGVYTPDRDTANPDGTGDREATFQLVNGVAIMGGYAGCGASDPDERDIDLHETALSGDLDGDDTPNESDCCHAHEDPGCDEHGCETTVCSYYPECCSDPWDEACTFYASNLCTGLCGGFSENSYHVVSGGGTDETAVLDGFTVASGKDPQ